MSPDGDAGSGSSESPLDAARRLLEELHSERGLARRVELAAGIEALGDANEDLELGALLCTALQQVALSDGAGPEVRLGAAERLRGLREAHGNAPFAEAEARVLASATVGLEDPAACLEIARRISDLNEHFGLEVVAGAEAVACFNAAAVSEDAALVRAIATRLGRLRAQHDTETVAAQESSAWVCASALAKQSSEAWSAAQRIQDLSREHAGVVLAEDEAKAVANAIDLEDDPETRQAGMRRLRELLDEHASEPIAVAVAHALYQVHGVHGGVDECRYAAGEVAELNESLRSTEVAVLEAHILRNATAEADDAATRDGFVARLEALMVGHPHVDIAAQLVHARLNQAASDEGPAARLPRLESAATLLVRLPSPMPAHRLGHVLATEQYNDPDDTRCSARLAVARRVIGAHPELEPALRAGADEVVARVYDVDAIARIAALWQSESPPDHD